MQEDVPPLLARARGGSASFLAPGLSQEASGIHQAAGTWGRAVAAQVWVRNRSPGGADAGSCLGLCTQWLRGPERSGRKKTPRGISSPVELPRSCSSPCQARAEPCCVRAAPARGGDGLGRRALGRAGSPGGAADGPGGPWGPDAVPCPAVLGCARMCRAVPGCAGSAAGAFPARRLSTASCRCRFGELKGWR